MGWDLERDNDFEDKNNWIELLFRQKITNLKMTEKEQFFYRLTFPEQLFQK